MTAMKRLLGVCVVLAATSIVGTAAAREDGPLDARVRRALARVPYYDAFS